MILATSQFRFRLPPPENADRIIHLLNFLPIARAWAQGNFSPCSVMARDLLHLLELQLYNNFGNYISRIFIICCATSLLINGKIDTVGMTCKSTYSTVQLTIWHQSTPERMHTRQWKNHPAQTAWSHGSCTQRARQKPPGAECVMSF